MPKIVALPPNTEGLAADDVFAIHNTSTGNTEKSSLTLVKEWLQTLTSWITNAMIGANEVTYDKILETTLSTTEKRVGTWIDGRPLYEKVLSLGSGTNSTTKSVNHSISNLDMFVSVVGFSGNFRTLPIGPTSTGSTSIIGKLSFSTTQVNWFTTYDATGETGYVTLRYVKT